MGELAEKPQEPEMPEQLGGKNAELGSAMALYLPIGLAVGVALGLLAGRLAVGVAIGLAVGVALGAGADAKRRGRQ